MKITNDDSKPSVKGTGRRAVSGKIQPDLENQLPVILSGSSLSRTGFGKESNNHHKIRIITRAGKERHSGHNLSPTCFWKASESHSGIPVSTKISKSRHSERSEESGRLGRNRLNEILRCAQDDSKLGRRNSTRRVNNTSGTHSQRPFMLNNSGELPVILNKCEESNKTGMGKSSEILRCAQDDGGRGNQDDGRMGNQDDGGRDNQDDGRRGNQDNRRRSNQGDGQRSKKRKPGFRAFSLKHVAYRLIFISLFLYGNQVFAQDLERVFSGGKAITVSGGVSANQVFYTASNIDNRRDPYNYFLSGNLNFDIYGFYIPLSYTFSNQNSSFQQPFNQFSLTPTYKNWRALLGYQSLNFSKYTLGGHIFFGGGLEVTSLGKWDISAMYGRFLRAVEPDSTDESNVPSFRRLGYSMKVRYNFAENEYAEFILLRSRDDENSINTEPEALEILPEENLALSFGFNKRIFSKIFLKAEYAASGITRDVRAEEFTPSRFNVISRLSPLFTSRVSSSYYDAFNTAVSYVEKSYSVGVSYERVDPGYETHGAYFFNSDLESISLNTQFRTLQERLNIGVNVGTQRNNLDGAKSNDLRRWVSSFNVNYMINTNVTLNANYSNFTTFTNVNQEFFDPNLLPFEQIDTLDYRQASQTASLNSNILLLRSDEATKNLNLNVTFQTTTDEQGGTEQNTGNNFYNVNAAYTHSLVSSGLSITGAMNVNLNDSPTLSTATLSPTVSVTKIFFDKKMRTTGSLTYNTSFVEGNLNNSVFNIRVNATYALLEKHNFNLSVVTLNRVTNNTGEMQASTTSFTEFTGTLGYSYSF